MKRDGSLDQGLDQGNAGLNAVPVPARGDALLQPLPQEVRLIVDLDERVVYLMLDTPCVLRVPGTGIAVAPQLAALRFQQEQPEVGMQDREVDLAPLV